MINFFNTFPYLLNEFQTPNNWNPFMYAVRYANMELIEYFTSKNMKINVNSIFNHVSMTHSAVYSGDVRILKHVLNVMKCSPNPPNSETSPLKIAMKVGNARMVEMLVAKGAYYVFGDVMNNVDNKVAQAGEEGSKYVSLLTGKDLLNSAVVEDSSIKDCAIKETLRWARARAVMSLHRRGTGQEMQDEGAKFTPMAKILTNKRHYELVLKMCIGNGDSITKSNEVNEEPKEEKVRESKRGG